jgi:hypothetical protein
LQLNVLSSGYKRGELDRVSLMWVGAGPAIWLTVIRYRLMLFSEWQAILPDMRLIKKLKGLILANLVSQLQAESLGMLGVEILEKFGQKQFSGMRELNNASV